MDLIIGKALKGRYNVVECFVLVRLVKISRLFAEIVENALLGGLNRES